jgi:hypothetical protein
MTQARVVAVFIAAVWFAACGPKPRPNTPPPVTKASLMAEGKEKVKRVLGYLEEMEQIRGVAKDEGSPIPVEEPPPPPPTKGKKGAKAAKPTPPPPPPKPAKPAGMDDSAVMELDRLIARVKEIKDQIVALREELAEVLEKAAEPPVGAELDKTRGILAKMSEKVGDARDQRTRALELKPKPPEPEKKAPAPAPAPAKK